MPLGRPKAVTVNHIRGLLGNSFDDGTYPPEDSYQTAEIKDDDIEAFGFRVVIRRETAKDLPRPIVG